MITTCLHQHEINQILENKDLQDLLTTVKEKTKENWQIIERKHVIERLFKKSVISYSYELFVEVGGCMPFQQINFYRENSSSSINISTSADVIAAFLIGMLNGIQHEEIKLSS